MNTSILVLGAGRSSSSLIQYLLETSEQNNWEMLVGDSFLENALEKVKGSKHGKALLFDINNESQSAEVIRDADLVISLLPPHFHPLVARHCLREGKHLVTASYVSEEMRSMHKEALEKNLIFLNECGLDPGIDHMSAMQVMDRIRKAGGSIHSFESFTGGLIAPQTDPENPWRYKFTWNPHNVVTAGQSTAKFLQEGEYKYIPYHQLFKRTTFVHVPGYGDFEGYANRDSLKYLEDYKLHGIKTMLRGTLRNDGFCAAWYAFVYLGCCDDSYKMEGVSNMTHREFFGAFVNYDPDRTLEERIAQRCSLAMDGAEMEKLKWMGMFDYEPLGLDSGSPAQILVHILNKKWKLAPHDKDMIVMWHRFKFVQNNEQKEIQASLVVEGEDSVHTAMAKTVGLPMAIASKLILQNKIKKRGVAIPVDAEIYEPVLAELKTLGVELMEREM